MIGKKRQGQAVELESCVSSLVKVTVSSKQRPIKLWNKLLEQTGRLAIPLRQSSPESHQWHKHRAGTMELSWPRSQRCPLIMFLQTLPRTNPIPYRDTESTDFKPDIVTILQITTVPFGMEAEFSVSTGLQCLFLT